MVKYIVRFSTLSVDYFAVTFGNVFSMSCIPEDQRRVRLVSVSWKGSANEIVKIRFQKHQAKKIVVFTFLL